LTTDVSTCILVERTMKYIRLVDAARIYAGWQSAPQPVQGGSNNLRSISVKDITDGHLVADSLERISTSVPGKVDRYLVQSGDVLVACRGTVPKVAVVPPDLAGALLTSTLIGIRTDGRLLPEVLFLYLLSAPGQRAILSRARSATQQIALTPREVAQLEVPLPRVHVQQRIADLVRTAEQQYAAAETASRLRREIAHHLALKSMEGEDTPSSRRTTR
jgi:hypothetical protein